MGEFAQGAATALYKPGETRVPKKAEGASRARGEAELRPEKAEAAQRPRADGKGSVRGNAAPASADLPKADFFGYDAKSSEAALDRAIEEANKKIMGYNKEFNYSVHEITKDIMIKVIDTETDEVVREIPPQKVLDAIGKMWELAGLLVDEKR